MDRDTKPMHDQEDNDETSEALSRAFSPQKDQSIEDEIQQATQTQELSPRRLQYRKFHLKNQGITTVTNGRQNTRLFS